MSVAEEVGDQLARQRNKSEFELFLEQEHQDSLKLIYEARKQVANVDLAIADTKKRLVFLEDKSKETRASLLQSQVAAATEQVR